MFYPNKREYLRNQCSPFSITYTTFQHGIQEKCVSLTSFVLTSLFILQPEDHRPMWYIHTITGEHRYKHRYIL